MKPFKSSGRHPDWPTLCLFFVSLIFVFYIACEMDHGIEPIRSGLQGVITYSGEWPGTAAEVRIVAAMQFPPSSVGDLILGESIPTDVNSFEYNFYLKPGTYNVIGVAWREQGSTWDIMSVCGLYFSGTDSLVPGQVAIASDTSIMKGINISVNRSKARRVTNSKITGAINFEGTWPDSISEVRVIASSAPASNIFALLQKTPTLLDLSFGDKIELYSESATYSINASPMTYYATGVIFFRTNQSLSGSDLAFSLQVGGLNVSQYDVLPDSTVAGPDFNIKFR